MDQQIDTELRAIHSRITDNDDTIELHSADISMLCGVVQSLAKRLHVVEELLAEHCGIEVKHLRDVARESDESRVADVVPGD